MKFGNKFGVVYNVKTFGQVGKAEKSELLAVGRGKDVVGYGGKRGFCRVVVWKPCWGEEKRCLPAM